MEYIGFESYSAKLKAGTELHYSLNLYMFNIWILKPVLDKKELMRLLNIRYFSLKRQLDFSKN